MVAQSTAIIFLDFKAILYDAAGGGVEGGWAE